MSRRKQSVPCKVGGSDEVPLTYNQPVVSIAPLSKYKISPNTSITDAKADSQSLTELNSLMSPSNDDKEGVSTAVNHTEQEMDAEDLNDFDSKDSLDNSSISTEMATKEELDAQLSSALLSYKQTNSSEPSKNKQRFSARIRAKVQLKALSLSPPGNGPKPMLLSRPLQQDLDADKVQAAKSELRQRNLSYEEELTCPICYKTFMSKYGLLTHTEVHATPELKCTMCNLAFSRRSAFVAHQIHCHADDYGDDELYQTHNFTPPNPKQRSNGATGFGDLSIIDFTCSKFPDIAGNLCVKSKHRLSDRDRRHFFMCKKCNALFPTLLVLERHVAKHHARNSSNSSGITPKLTILGKTYIINSDMAAAATAAVVVDSAVDGDKASSNSAVAVIPSTALPSPADTRGFMDALNLKSSAAAAVLVAAKGISGDKPEQCSYGTDNDLIRTSPLIAFLNVPQWLRSSNDQQNWTAAGVVPEDQDRPPLRLKLLRCRSTGSEESSGELKLLRSVDSYLVNSSSAVAAVSKTLVTHSCSVCGEGFASQRAVESHRAGSACGIGVRSSTNGRKMFWCRLCNYASFEKSTIMRHQRTHTGIRPYSCKFCHLAFTTKANCERHVRKRHIAQVPNEADVKEAVECDEELLKKARSGGSEFKPYQAKGGLVTSPEQHLFKCRLCKSVFTTRSNGARHVMDKHHIYSRKGANEMVTYLQQNRVEPRHRPIAPAPGISSDDGTVHFVSKRTLDGIHHQHQQSPATLFRGKKRRPEVPNGPQPPVKIPRLIPLSKIEAYHVSSQKLAQHFRSNYAEVLDNLGVAEGGKRANDIRRMSSTLVSLLASTSALLLENNAPTATDGGARAHHRVRYRSGDVSNRYASLHPNSSGASHVRGARSAASVAASLQSYVKSANANPPPMKRTQWGSSNRIGSQKKATAISRPLANSTSYHELVQLYADGKWDGDEQDKALDSGGFSSSTDVLQLTSGAARKETGGGQTAERHSSSSSHDSNPIPIRKQIKLELLANNPASQALQLRQVHRDGQQAGAKGTTSPDLASIKRLVDFVHQPGPLVQNGVRGSPQQDGVNVRDDDTSPLGGDTRGKYRMVALKPKTNEPSKANSGLTWKFIPYPPETRDEKGRYMKDPEKKRSSLGSNDGFSPFLADVSRPTMVAMSRGPNRTPSGFATRAHYGEKNLCLRSRKCPKCNKTFPWASSLRRHIMTHTGLKPYMCARCSMRFTTRSNLLRHAYRRHAVARGSEEQRKVLITLTRKEQEERASIEAEEHGAIQGGAVEEEEEEAPLVIDAEEYASDNDHEEGIPLVETQPKVETSKVTDMIDISNKRFMCGLCNVPFANRSNVVRHLHRLHSITKDDHNFRQLLVKIDHSNPPRLAESTRFTTPRVTLHKTLPVSPVPLVVETPKEVETIEVKSQPVPKANIEEAPATPEPVPVLTTPTKTKPFKCTICSIGFTKRNNAARHVHQQHHISKHRANFANLIEKVDSSPERADAPDSPTTPLHQQKQSEKPTPGAAAESHPQDTEQDEAAEEEKPDSKELAKAIEVVVGVSSLPPSPLAETTPPAPAPPPAAPAPIQPPTGHVWRSRRMSAKRRLEAGEPPEPIPPPPKVEPKQSSKSTQFVCGVCKRIFKLVEELKEHLEEHNIPHPWHCPLCGVPFTNKYNCQRHLTRRHGETSMEPKYVEDVRHGPRHPRKRSRRTM